MERVDTESRDDMTTLTEEPDGERSRNCLQVRRRFWRFLCVCVSKLISMKGSVTAHRSSGGRWRRPVLCALSSMAAAVDSQ